MRISTQQIYANGLQSMQNDTQQLQQTQQQLSSGLRVNHPSDDPVASARIIELNQTLSQSSQYQTNINLATNHLNMEEGALSSVTDTISNIRGLVVQAGDGSLSSSDRQDIATQLNQDLQQLVGLANTQSSNGEYIFGGFQAKQQPFVQDAGGSWVYQGDQGQRSMQVDSNLTVPVNDSGDSVFMNVPSAQNTVALSANPKNTAQPPATISGGKVTDQSTFDSFYPDNMKVTFANTGPGGQLQYSITDSTNGKQLVAPTNYTSGVPISAEGVQFQINGTPAAGDSFSVQSTQYQSVFQTVQNVIDGLNHVTNTGPGQQALSQLLSDTLTNLDSAQSNVSTVTSEVGSRLNTLSSTQSLHQNSDQQTQTVLSQVQDLDYAKASSDLSMQNMVLQAAQMSFSQVTKLSLFSRL